MLRDMAVDTSHTTATAPASLEELRRLVATIRQGQAGMQLGARAFGTLAGLVDDPRRAAVYSISQLAATLGVNPSTLTRLAKRLGYAGFSEFQAVFRRHVAEGRDFYSERAGRLLQAEESAARSLSLMTTIAEDEAANISTMIGNLDPDVIEHTAALLARAASVRLHGLRQFYSIACFIAYGLGMIRDDVGMLGDPGHGVAHALAQLDAGDVLVVIGSAPYTRATVEACEIAAAHGLRIVAITDSYASPLATAAEQILITPTGGTFFGNSTAACLILAEGLLAMVARALGAKAVEALKKREKLIEELGIALSLPHAPR